MTTVTEVPSAQVDLLDRFRADVQQIVNFGETLVITDADEAELATEVLARIAKTKKQVNGQRLKITRPLDEAKKAAITQEKEVLAPLEKLDQVLRDGIGNFHAEQERKRREEQARIERERAEAEAKARAEAEEAEREARRREYEADRRKTEDARARQEAAAEKAHQAADLARLQEKVAQESPLPSTEKAGPTRAMSGSASTRMVWDFKITDESEIPREFLVVDVKKIRQAMRDGIDGDDCATSIPGVEFFRKPQVQVR